MVFGWMFLALLITGLVAFFIAFTPIIITTLISNFNIEKASIFWTNFI